MSWTAYHFTFDDIRYHARTNCPDDYAYSPSKWIIDNKWRFKDNTSSIHPRYFCLSTYHGRVKDQKEETTPDIILGEVCYSTLQMHRCNEEKKTFTFNVAYDDGFRLNYPFNHLLVLNSGTHDIRPLAAFLSYCDLVASNRIELATCSEHFLQDLEKAFRLYADAERGKKCKGLLVEKDESQTSTIAAEPGTACLQASDHHTHEKEQTTGAAGQITDSGHIKSLDTTISDVQAEGSVSEKDDTTLQNENIALRRKLRTKEDLLAALNTQLDMAREETQVYKNKYEELLADVTRMIERRK